ncbi:MAG TPA: hypothetical protein VFZ58_04685 [Candidatus Saccharimonadales bacterium]
MDTLTLVLVIGLIGMGIINAASLIWAGYLDRKLRGKPTPKHYDVHVEGTKVFPEVDRQAVEAKAEALLVEAVERAAVKLQASLDTSATEIAQHIETATTQELEKYHANLEQLSSKSVASFDALQAELAERRRELFKQLDEEVSAEREKRLQAFNAKFNDIVTSYITESLGSQVDLGAEAPYIFEVLNTHKDDIKRDVLS